MLVAKDYYKLLLTIADTEFADAQDVQIIDLSIIEEAGVRLPTMELIFDCISQDIIALLHEGSELKISLSKDGAYSSGYTLEQSFFLLSPQITYAGYSMWRVKLVGIQKTHPKWLSPIHGVQPKQNSKKTLQEKAIVYGKVDLKCKADPKDDMSWVAHGQTLGQFIQDVWLHSDLRPSVMMCSPTLEGFRIYNLDEILKEKPKWVANYQGDPTPLGIVYEPSYSIVTNTALVNTLGVKGMERNVYDADSGKLNKTTTKRANKTVQTKTDNVSKEHKNNYMPTTFRSRNVHKGWYEAYDYNTLELKYMGTVKATIMFSDCLKNIHPLDTVMFFERSLSDGTAQKLESTEQNSGIYIVTKVSRRLVNNTIRTLVEMCRESSVLKDPKADKEKEKKDKK